MGPGSPPATPNAVCVLCVVCFCRCAWPLQVCMSVCRSVLWQRSGRNGYVLLCVGDSGTTGPFTSLLQQQEMTPALAHSPRKIRSLQWSFCCAVPQGQQLPHRHDTLALGIHTIFPEAKGMGTTERAMDHIRRTDVQPWSVNS